MRPKKIEAIGQATAEAYRKQNAALGQAAITAIEVVKKIAEGNIRITPDILVSGEKGGLLDVLIAQLVKKEAVPTQVAAESSKKGLVDSGMQGPAA